MRRRPADRSSARRPGCWRPRTPAAQIASATSRVPAGSSCAVGSSSTRCSGRMASSPAIATSCCWPPERCRGSRSARDRMPSVSSADQVRVDHLVAGTARFIGPNATSSKTVPATCDSCVAGFWKPMPMRSLSRCIGQASVSSPSSVILPRICPPTVRGARPRRPGRASSCPPPTGRPGRPPHRRAGRGRCRAATRASRRRSDSRPRPARASCPDSRTRGSR